MTVGSFDWFRYYVLVSNELGLVQAKMAASAAINDNVCIRRYKIGLVIMTRSDRKCIIDFFVFVLISSAES